MNEQPADLAEQLAEMTRLRDNALRAAAHADQSIHIDLEGLINDGLFGRWDWDGDESPPEDLVRAIVGIVRPVIAHAVKRAETAEAANDRVREVVRVWSRCCLESQTRRFIDDLRAALDRSDLPAINEFIADLDPRKST